MRKKIKQYVSMLMVMLMAISAIVFCGAEKAYAGSFSGGYISLGADLTSDEKAKVLALFGVDEKDLDSYKVVYVTNQEEHQYLDSYISSSQIGNQAWSSVLITEGKKGSGINVTTKNVIYCTTGMYANALATAGVEDVNVVVAGPFNVSGTAALVGALKAYSEMTGETVDEDVVDAAVDEMVTTGSLEDGTDADNEKVEGMVAYLKEQIAQQEGKISAWISAIENDQTRQIFRMRFIGCLTWAEVAQVIGGRNTENGVKSVCYRYLGASPDGCGGE